jgi:DNA-binding protein H-NS
LSCTKMPACLHRAAREPIKEFVVKAIRSMTLNELIKTKVEIESAIYSVMQAEQARQLKAAMTEKLSSKGSRTGRISERHPLKGRTLPVRFRNPKNRRETWAGRGHKPRWLVAALKSKKSKMSDFAVR